MGWVRCRCGKLICESLQDMLIRQDVIGSKSKRHTDRHRAAQQCLCILLETRDRLVICRQVRVKKCPKNAGLSSSDLAIISPGLDFLYLLHPFSLPPVVIQGFRLVLVVSMHG